MYINEIENNIIYNFSKVKAIFDFRRKMRQNDQEFTDRYGSSVIPNANIAESKLTQKTEIYGKNIYKPSFLIIVV